MTNGKGVDGLIFDFKKSFKKGLFNYGQDIVMAFLLPAVGCLIKKGLQKGESQAPQNPPGYAHALSIYVSKQDLDTKHLSMATTIKSK